MINPHNNLLSAVIAANELYLENRLNNPQNKVHEEKIKKLFHAHMREIAIFCEKHIYKSELTESSIKKLHKLLFPSGYKESQKTIAWDGIIVYMTPWAYKVINNFSYVAPSDVKKEMRLLVESYNSNINKNISTEEKYEIILDFFINFLRIHPFGNGNGRVASILLDALLVSNDFTPVNFKKLQYIDIEEAVDAIKMSITLSDTRYIKDFIHKYI